MPVNGSARPRLLSFQRSGSEPTFSTAQADIFTGHVLSEPCIVCLLLLFSADICVIIVSDRRFVKRLAAESLEKAAYCDIVCCIHPEKVI